MVAGEGIASPTGRDIDGKYLDQNEQDLKTRYVKFQKDWPLFGVTLMCDSWTQSVVSWSSGMPLDLEPTTCS